jgi:hypothetical protein
VIYNLSEQINKAAKDNPKMRMISFLSFWAGCSKPLAEYQHDRSSRTYYYVTIKRSKKSDNVGKYEQTASRNGPLENAQGII